jgi:hypothetical protein
MKFIRFYFYFAISLIFIFAIVLAAKAQQTSTQFPIKGAEGKWFVDGEKRLSDVKVAEFLGRKSLWLKNSSHVISTDSPFTDGTIEFDAAPMTGGHFVAVLFRRESATNYENIYLRAHKSGQYNAMQYAPTINGSSTWQLYPEFNRTIDFPRNQWTHVRVEVEGTKTEIYINDSAEPVLTVHRMRSNSDKGDVAFWARINNQPDAWAAAISNIKITHKKTTKVSKIEQTITPPVGTLGIWQVAKPFENKTGAVLNVPNLEGWKTVEAEESGIINLNRAVGSPRGRWTTFAKTNINSDKAKTVKLKFGYSDDVTIFLNGKPIFSGVNGWEARYPESMGFVKIGNEEVFLNLQKGDNELMFAVTNQTFGWGFIAQMKELE